MQTSLSVKENRVAQDLKTISVQCFFFKLIFLSVIKYFLNWMKLYPIFQCILLCDFNEMILIYLI